MALLSLIKKQFTASKIIFHVLFWSFQWFIFGYGWCVFECLSIRHWTEC